MSDPDDDSMTLIEKFTIMKFVLEQRDWLMMALLARCGGQATITKEELEFIRKSYEMDESVKSLGQVMTDVNMKLKLKS
jgi:hypothetical protein